MKTHPNLLDVLGLVAAVAFAHPASAQSGMSAPPPQRAPDDAILSVTHLENQNRLAEVARERRNLGIDLKGYQLSKRENKLLRELQFAIHSPDLGKAKAALLVAEPAVQSPDARFVFAALKLQLATKAQDEVLQSAATDELLAMGRTPLSQLPALIRNQASFALKANNFVKAEAAFERLIAIGQADAETIVSLAQIKSNLGKYKEALPLYEKAITMQSHAGKSVPEVWNTATRYARQRAQQGG